MKDENVGFDEVVYALSSMVKCIVVQFDQLNK